MEVVEIVDKLGRVVFALMGAVLGAVLVALAEARGSLLGSGADPVGLRAVAVAEFSVLGPLALGVGVAVAAASLFLEPDGPVAPTERIAAWRSAPVLARSRTAALAPLVGLASAAWLVVTAQTARAVLASAAPTVAGGALAATSIAWLCAIGAAALAVMPSVRRLLAHAASRWPLALDPVITGAAGVGIAVIVVAVGVGQGDTGGQGPGPLAIFGVLRRNELDLRPVVDLMAIAACAWLAPLVVGAAVPRALALAIALMVVVASLYVTVHEAVALERDPAPALAVEARAPLGRIALSLARRLTDHDHDGASPYFGGGDCNDNDPRISPFAVEIPGNGVDEDCSGADLPLAAVAPPPAQAQPHTPAVSVSRDYNLVFITVDTLRASEMGFLGYDKPTTPNLDAFAARAVVFERAYAMASYTGKALAPMLIGKYPSETLRDGGHFNKYFAGNTFLAERLRRAGIHTMGAASHWYFKESFGLTRGFDVFDLSAMPRSGQGETDTSVTSPQLTDAAIRLLDSQGGSQRFFLWVHYFDPHLQYVAHDGAPEFADAARPPGWRMRAAYDGEVWFTDKAIGRLLDHIAGQPWGKDTIVVMTSDHGEAMNEHGMGFQHGFEIWEPLVRVPLVFRVPGAPPHRVPLKRSVIDLVPTILDLMRVPPPPAGELSGQSFAADVMAKPGDPFEERDVYIDMPDGPYTHMRRGFIHGLTPGTKLIHFGGRQYQLYDLARDANEMEDLAGDKARLSPMVSALQAKRASLKEIEVKPVVPPPP